MEQETTKHQTYGKRKPKSFDVLSIHITSGNGIAKTFIKNCAADVVAIQAHKWQDFQISGVQTQMKNAEEGGYAKTMLAHPCGKGELGAPAQVVALAFRRHLTCSMIMSEKQVDFGKVFWQDSLQLRC